MSCPVTLRDGGPIFADGVPLAIYGYGDPETVIWMQRRGGHFVQFVTGRGEVEPIPGFPVSFTTDSGAGSLCLL